MSKTLSQMLNQIDEAIPNAFPTTSKINFINDAVRLYWTDMCNSTMYEWQLSSGVALYSLPTNCQVSHIVERGVLISDATAAPTSSAEWATYTFKGADEELESNNYYEGEGKLGLYELPDNGYYARMEYLEYPIIMDSSDNNTQFDLDQDYIDLIFAKSCVRIAKSGKFPRVDLANNYEADVLQLERKLRLQQRKERVKTSRERYDYRDWR